MPQYQDYAVVYDATGQLRFSLRMLAYLDDLLVRFPAPGKRMIDLGCGTGTVALGMAERGWSVRGVDLSACMLAQAQAKPGADAVAWQQGDMRQLVVEQPVDLVTSLYDSMNYMLSEADLRQAFAAVAAALVPGGLFVFDMNTLAHFEDVDGSDFVGESDDATVIMACDLAAAAPRLTITMTCFQREGELYRRFHEVHYEQAYPLEHIATLLQDAGLRVEAVYTCFGHEPPGDDTHRVLFVAAKHPC